MQTIIIERAVKAGINKSRRSLTELFTLSVLGGVFIALGGTLSIMIGQGCPGISVANPGFQRLLCGMAFPVGLFMIIMFGADLFTGNNALLIPGWHRGDLSAREVVVNWILVWIGNFIGAMLFTTLLVWCAGLFEIAPYGEVAVKIAESKAGLSPWVTFVRGIGANWCVCLAVWLALGADTMGAKAIGVWIPVSAFVVLGYEHCIANMFFIPCGMLYGANVSIGSLFSNLLFATLGNIVGGALFVGHLMHRLYGKRK